MSRRWWALGDCHIDGESGSDSEKPDDGSIPHPIEVGRQLIELLIDVRLASIISSRLLCFTCWWTAKAGAVGMVRKLGLPLGLMSIKHDPRHVDNITGFLQSARSQAILRRAWLGVTYSLT